MATSVQLLQPVTGSTIVARNLAGDRRRSTHRLWNEWALAAADLSNRFQAEFQDNPFAYNETASVSFLSAAAAQAGMLGLAEYRAPKRWAENRRYVVDGRCDLWVGAGSHQWAFEFKQLAVERFTSAQLIRSMRSAIGDAICLDPRAGIPRVAGLLVSLHWVEDEDLQPARDLIRKFARRRDYAWELSSLRSGSGGTFLLFDIVDRRGWKLWKD